MRGLDPRIHHSSEDFSKMMDCRVKPGNDAGWAVLVGWAKARLRRAHHFFKRLGGHASLCPPYKADLNHFCNAS
jgi:hypothetical protein